jgi:hypothetical protein
VVTAGRQVAGAVPIRQYVNWPAACLAADKLRNFFRAHGALDARRKHEEKMWKQPSVPANQAGILGSKIISIQCAKAPWV